MTDDNEARIPKIKSVPLVRIHVERRKEGFIYILRDRNNIESGRAVVPSDNAQSSFDAAWLDFCFQNPGEELFPHQISVPAGVIVTTLKANDIAFSSMQHLDR